MWTALLIFQSLLIYIRGDCGPPPTMDHTLAEVTSGAPGTTVVYKCDHKAGYYELPNKNRIITCQDDGTWSPFSEFCAIVECPDPGGLRHGRRTSGFVGPYTLNSAVRFECDKNYVLEGSSTITCTSNNVWEPEIPKCQPVECPDPGELRHGRRISGVVGPYTLNSAVRFECDKSYVLEGSSTITCTSTNMWDSDIPNCLPIECPDPGEVQNGRRKLGRFGKRSVVEHPDPEQVRNRRRQLVINECPDPGQVQNGRRKSGFLGPYTLNYVVEFECEENFVLLGSSSITCSSNNKWEPEIPKCQQPVCDHIWKLQEEARKCTSTPDEWIKYLQLQYLYLQIENLKLDIEIKKRELNKMG